MYIVADPSIFEIEEVLAQVAKRHDLRQILPKATLTKNAEFLKSGWCYLFYDEKTLAPLGYCNFELMGGQKSAILRFGTTTAAKPNNIHCAWRAMRNVIKTALNYRASVYIHNERFAKFANKCGFSRKIVKSRDGWAYSRKG